MLKFLSGFFAFWLLASGFGSDLSLADDFAARTGGNTLPTKWWKAMGSIRRFMPGQDFTTAASIISQLDALKTKGYNIIEITAPYKSAGFYPWWGLRPLDYFSVNQNLSTDIEGFKNLVRECHNRGMACIAFINLGYDDVASASWKQAQQDEKLGVKTEVSSYYRFSTNSSASPGNAANPFFAQAGTIYQKASWVPESVSGEYYWSAWQNSACNEPEYDWSNANWQSHAKTIIQFWMNTGLDGIILDAPAWYLNSTFKILKSSVIDVIHSYPNTMVIMEGAGGLKEDYVQWITRGGFDICDDQYFESDLNWNGSKIYDSIQSGNPSALESDLVNYHDKVLAAGGVLWNYPSWGTQWTVSKRLLDVAVLIGTGRLVDVWPEYTSGWSAIDLARLENIMRAGSTYSGLSPAGMRKKLKTNNDNKYYAFLKTYGENRVLCVYNFQQSSQTFTVDLEGVGITLPQTSIDCLTHGECPALLTTSFTVTLGSLGYAFYNLPKK